MLRFINLSDQINEGEKEFAFYDTVKESFVTLSGSQTWASVDDFTKDYQDEQGSKHNYARMVRLIPNVSETLSSVVGDDTLKIGHHHRTTKGNSEYRSISVPPVITQGNSLRPQINRPRKRIIDEMLPFIENLTPDERTDLFLDYCKHCGEPTPGNERCYCSVW